MKICFFKRDTDFLAGQEILLKNGKALPPMKGFHRLQSAARILVPFGAVLPVLWLGDPSAWLRNLLLLLPIYFAMYVPHELCHGLFCAVTGKRVERICFFPRNAAYGAYVLPAFAPMSRRQGIFFALFPLLVLTMLFEGIGLFFPSVAFYMHLCALANVAMSTFDLCDALQAALMPRGALCFWNPHFWAMPEREEMEIHRLTVTADGRTLCHEHYGCTGTSLVRRERSETFPELEALLQDMQKRFPLLSK